MARRPQAEKKAAASGLARYRRKRRFDVTTEPRGAKSRLKGNAFVVQKHDATRLHYDLRLELDGVMKSWAVTRGPSLVPGDKRLAIHVEDHPISYNAFEGTIPKGEYGGGTVMIWDRGTWEAEGDPHFGYNKGHLNFRLDGEKLHGSWHLVRMHKREGERQDPWLLIKVEDDAARAASAPDILEELPRSALTGRDLKEIAAGRAVRKKAARATTAADAVWHSNRPADENAAALGIARRKTARKATPTKTKAVKASAAKAKSAQAKPAPTAKRPAAAKSRTPKKTAKKKAKDSAPGGPRSGWAALPEFVPPCLATLSASAPDAANWLHEIKFDGYRMQARLADGKVRLRTRRGLDWTARFASIAKALEGLDATQALIDGEIVVETSDGHSSFGALQEALKAGGGDFIFYAFDLLHLDGQDFTAAPLTERRQTLQALLQPLQNHAIRLSEHFETEGSLLLEHACRMDLEGIISKRVASPYRSGRNGDWVKTKCSDRQEFVVIGYATATNDARAIGALILGYYDGKALRYAGRVGTGYTDKIARELWRQLQPLRIDAPALKPLPTEERGRKPLWVAPKLVAEIDVRGWTHAMRLRHASFKGLREDKRASEVVREDKAMATTPQAAASPKSAGKKKPARATKAKSSQPVRAKAVRAKAAGNPLDENFHLTNPDRVYWEDVGLTKRGLADYYAGVWEWIAPHVVGRALSLVRCPEGTAGQCFFQKHASAGLDDKQLRLVPEDDGYVIAIDDIGGLMALVQAGVLEIHVRGSTVARLDAADRIVFDLDPAPDVGWPDVVRAAREVRERLAALDLESYLKTTGGKGLHVVLPIRPVPWDDVKAFARALAFEMATDSPERFIAVASKKERAGRIFVDYLRNSREATAICAYSTRARAGATVSVPIGWEELGKLGMPNRYTVANLAKRLGNLKRDPWADIGKEKQKLPMLAKGRKG